MPRPLVRPIVRPLVRGVTEPAFGGWSPRVLFAGGEQGAWYDPSDLSSLYQDSAGTTPVTALGQPVGLMLDKSKGLVRGEEICPQSGSFTAATGWTPGTAGSISGGVLWINGSGNIVSGGTATINKWYEITVVVADLSDGSFRALFNGGVSASPAISAPGTYVFRLQCSNTGAMYLWASSGTPVGSVTRFSVRELPGNHASQPTATARPTLQARVNLLTANTDAFDGTGWGRVRVTVTPNQSTGPEGSLTLDAVFETVDNNTHHIDASPGVTAIVGQTFTFSAYVRKRGRQYVTLDAAGSVGYATFDLDSGAVSSVSNSASIEAIDDGLFRISMSAVATATTVTPRVWASTVSADPRSIFYVGDVTKGFDIGKAQLEFNSAATTYQHVTTAIDYADVGAKRYLQFDGVDDFLVTAAIDFTGTDKMTVVAGVRKESDAAQGAIAELTASTAANNGSFLLAAPDGATATYAFDSKGTVQTDAVGSGFTAPLTSVLTGTGNIAGDSAVLRVNGTQADADAGDQGTGNYANAALYIGHRGGTTLPFKGNLYSLLIRGAVSTAAQITAAERYAAAKTGVTLA